MNLTSTNIYSQLIANLSNLNAQLGSLSNLPADASGIKNTSQSLIQSDISNLKSIQTLVLNYTTPTIPILNAVLADLKNNNPSTASEKINKANDDAKILAGSISEFTSGILDTKTQIINLSTALAIIDQNLKAQIINLKSQAQDAQNEADYYNKRKYYFLALGPFGLVGLGIAIGFLVSWTNKANDLSAQVSALNVQATSIQLLVTNVDALINNFTDAVNQISNIKNSIDFLSADIQNVINDLNNSSIPNAVLFLTAVIHELEMLQGDAS